MTTASLLQVIAQEANRFKVRPQSVFKVQTYTGNATNRTIPTDFDMSEPGSLAWGSPRDGRYDQFWSAHDVEFSPNVNEANVYSEYYGPRPVAGGASLRGSGPYNESAVPYVLWTFKKQARFFTSILYTGNGVSGRAVAHDLGGEPGFVVIKRVNTNTNWYVWHRGLAAGQALQLNAANASFADTTRFNAAPNAESLVLGSGADVNANGAPYIAYLFAHTPPLIHCGVATAVGGAATVGLGWEPQFLLLKHNGASANWNVVDTARGWGAGSPKTIRLNGGGTEYDTDSGAAKTGNGFNLSGVTNGDHLFMAIRAEY